jgi:hypothetical protein
MAGACCNDRTTSGTSQMGVVELIDGRRVIGSTWEASQWLGDEWGDELGFWSGFP